jgi:hypothetical protein
MSQTIFSSIVPSTTSGIQLASVLEDFKDAVVSGFSGTARPAQLQAGGYWIDLTDDGDGLWYFKLYDGSQDITIFTIDKNSGTATIAFADTLFEVGKSSDDTVGPILRLYKERIASGGQTLDGDILGEVRFAGLRDDAVIAVQAKIKSVSTDNVTSSNQGSYISFEVTGDGSASLSEVMRVVDGKVAIGVTSPDNTFHVVGNGSRVEKISDDAVSAKVNIRKKRIANSGKVLSADSLGSLEFLSTDDAGSEVVGAIVEAVAVENHTTTAHGTKIVVKNKKATQTSHTTQVEISDDVTVKTNLIIDGNLTVSGTTITANTTNMEVEDANISVNKGGNQATANASKAGIKVEMSDATHAQIGYDSSKSSKFVIGEVGSEVEVVSVSHTQTLSNKTLTSPTVNSPSIVTPSRSDVKQDTYANLATYAATASNGQKCFGTDDKTYYNVVDGALVEEGSNLNYQNIELTTTAVDWNLATVFWKNISADTTLTFSNVIEGKTINIVVYNTGAGTATVTLPTAKSEVGYTGAISAGKEAVFTVIRSNGKYYVTSIVDLA